MTLLDAVAKHHRHDIISVYRNGFLVHYGHAEDVRKCITTMGDECLPVVNVGVDIYEVVGSHGRLADYQLARV